MDATLLVELFCEELPPKALKRLGEAFAEGLHRGLAKREMLGPDSAARAFATPRRLAASIDRVKSASAPRAVQVKLMPAAVALDAAGRPTAALLKKLEAAGLSGTDVSKLQRRLDGKAEMLFADAVGDRHQVLGFDHFAIDARVTGCDITAVPLEDDSVDIAVLSLALMGVNRDGYLAQTCRILPVDGQLWLAETTNHLGTDETRIR